MFPEIKVLAFIGSILIAPVAVLLLIGNPIALTVVVMCLVGVNFYTSFTLA